MSAWGSFVVAAVALAQYWVIAAWRRFFRPGTLDIYPIGTIGVGFSNLGPLLLLTGSARAIHSNFVVSAFSATVTRQRDNSRHTFEWVASAEGTAPNMIANLPAAFLVSSDRPERYGALLADTQTQEDVTAQLQPVQAAWVAAVVANPPTTDADKDALWQPIMASPGHVAAHAELGRIDYWMAGDYTLDLRITTRRPDRDFHKLWNFTLTQQDADLLRLNSISALRQITGLPVNFHWANVRYHDAPQPDA